MATLDLFPARVAFVDADGRLTPEAYRALQALFKRVGGAYGDDGVDVFAPFAEAPVQTPMDFQPVEIAGMADMIMQGES